MSVQNSTVSRTLAFWAGDSAPQGQLTPHYMKILVTITCKWHIKLLATLVLGGCERKSFQIDSKTQTCFEAYIFTHEKTKIMKI